MGSGWRIHSATSSQKCLTEAQEAQVPPSYDQVFFVGLSRGYQSQPRDYAGATAAMYILVVAKDLVALTNVLRGGIRETQQ